MIVLYQFSSDYEGTWPEAMLPPPPRTTCTLFSFPYGYYSSVWLRSRNLIYPKSLIPMPRDWFIRSMKNFESFWCKMQQQTYE